MLSLSVNSRPTLTTRSTTLGAAAALVALLAVPGTASAALLIDFNSGTIDPPGDQGVDATAAGAATEAELEAVTPVFHLQDYRQSTVPSNGSNTLVFTADVFPDIQINQLGSHRGESGGPTSGSGGTGDEAIDFVDNDNVASITMEFEIGSHSFGLDGSPGGGDDSFDPDALLTRTFGFVLVNLPTGATIQVDYFDAAGDIFATQTQAGDSSSEGNGIDIVFGLAESSTAISKVHVTRTDSVNALNTPIADLTFGEAVVIPEPASFALMGVGVGLLSSRRRRG